MNQHKPWEQEKEINRKFAGCEEENRCGRNIEMAFNPLVPALER